MAKRIWVDKDVTLTINNKGTPGNLKGDDCYTMPSSAIPEELHIYKAIVGANLVPEGSVVSKTVLMKIEKNFRGYIWGGSRVNKEAYGLPILNNGSKYHILDMWLHYEPTKEEQEEEEEVNLFDRFTMEELVTEIHRRVLARE